MARDFYFDWEVKLIEMLQSGLNPTLVKIVSLITDLGDSLIFVAILTFFYLSYDKEKGKTIGLNVIVAFYFGSIIKGLVMRCRPYINHESIKCLKAPQEGDMMNLKIQGYSFPSGHSTNSAVGYGTLAKLMKKKAITIICVILIFLVGLSRSILGVHYPTDVMTGWALGTTVVFLIPYIRDKFKNENVFFLILCILGIPGFFVLSGNEYYTSYGLLIGLTLANFFEEKYVKFENTEKILGRILRPVFAIVIYAVLAKVLKLPFSKELLESDSILQHIIRVVRYCIIMFTITGLYPMCFKKVKFLG
ncbi:MAG: phosphatase PAP2 family protein [Lachnospiraceae bacterium]|nr:phosphatase PAP2 family protein [Lachnospiraceae bacterium]